MIEQCKLPASSQMRRRFGSTGTSEGAGSSNSRTMGVPASWGLVGKLAGRPGNLIVVMTRYIQWNTPTVQRKAPAAKMELTYRVIGNETSS
jgi:hypothetical protein